MVNNADISSFKQFVLRNVNNSRLFPNYKTFETVFSSFDDRRQFSEKEVVDSRRSLFSEFDSLLWKNLSALLGSKPGKARFGRFGVGKLSTISKDFYTSLNDSSLETILCSDRDSGEVFWGIAAHPAFYQLLLDSYLGYNVSKVYKKAGGNERNVFHKQTSAIERELFRATVEPLQMLCPLVYESLEQFKRAECNRRIEWSCSPFITLDSAHSMPVSDVDFYWERRSFEISGNRFSWAILAPISLFSNSSKDISRARGRNEEPIRASARVDSSYSNAIVEIPSSIVEGTDRQERRAIPSGNSYTRKRDEGVANTESLAEPNVLCGTNEDFDSYGNPTIKVNVEIGTGEVGADVWRSLEAGSVLTTEIDANELFLARLENGTTYMVKPGVYRGRPAFQVKKEC